MEWTSRWLHFNSLSLATTSKPAAYNLQLHTDHQSPLYSSPLRAEVSLLVLGGMTIVSTLVFSRLKGDDGNAVSQHKVVLPAG